MRDFVSAIAGNCSLPAYSDFHVPYSDRICRFCDMVTGRRYVADFWHLLRTCVGLVHRKDDLEFCPWPASDLSSWFLLNNGKDALEYFVHLLRYYVSDLLC